MNLPDPNALRAQAARIEADAPAVSDSSEYPRLALFACRGQADALKNLAETIDATGGGIPEKRPGMTGEERRERRAALLRLRSAQQRLRAANAQRVSHDIGCRIPFGQPILVGHHSERGHRRAIEKMQARTSEAYHASKYADTLEARADSVERSHAIHASDSDAVEATQEKLDKLTAARDRMKATNKAWRKFERTKDPTELHALGFDDSKIETLTLKIASAYSWEKAPYVGWQITNLGATIRDTAKKLEYLQAVKAQPEATVEGNGIRLEDSPAENRVRLFYPGKPAPEIRQELKRNGFRWAPSLGCWQAFRNWRAMSHAHAAIGKEYRP